MYLLKKQSGRTEYSTKTQVQLVVVDLDKSGRYPQNFVCILPQTITSQRQNIFSQIFGTSSAEVAVKLLQRALKREKDNDIRKELTRRLMVLKTDSD